MLFVFLAGWVLKEHKIKHINPRKHRRHKNSGLCDAHTTLSEGGYKWFLCKPSDAV